MKLKGILLASAALGLMAGGAAVAADPSEEGGEIQCQGINSCKGHGECAASDGSHECGGKNACKGKGWVSVKTEKECVDKGGKVIAEDSDS